MESKNLHNYVDSDNLALKAEPGQGDNKSSLLTHSFNTKSPFKFVDFAKIANSTMDNLDAPQWADFVAPSPHLTMDDFFMRKHETHEYRSKSESGDFNSSPNHSTNFNNESCADTIYEKTPKKAPSSKVKSSSSKKTKIKNTTYEAALTEAMSNLQLSFKMMKADKSMNKSCLMDSPATFKTPIAKRVTRSMCAQAATPTSALRLDETRYLSLEKDMSDHEHEHDHVEENKENVDVNTNDKDAITGDIIGEDKQVEGCVNVAELEHVREKDEKVEHESPSSEQTSEINLEVTETSTEPDVSNDKLEPKPQAKSDDAVGGNQSQQLSKGTVVTSFNLKNTSTGSGSFKKKTTTLTGNAWHRQVKRRISISNQRRLSLNKSSINNKYVSMAEAVTKFQRSTPQRFHSTKAKTSKTELLKRQSFKLTKAMSPALMCKNRTRPVTVLSTEEKEKLELEKLRQNQIKANPVRVRVLKKPAPLKKVEKKMITNPEPFHLTQTKKGQPPQSKPSQTQEYKRIQRVPAKTVPSIVSTDEKSVTIKEEQVLHFGIPLEPVMKKKTTKMIPFSFEARNRELQARKQEKLKLMQESEQQKVKAEFHARPVPAAVKTPCNNILAPKAASANKTKKITIARSLSFEERNKQIQKKKEEKIKQMIEEEKKMRTFKAQKVPEFKPVLVKGRSKDNLFGKSCENLAGKSQNISVGIKKTDNSMKKSNEKLEIKKTNGVPAMKKSHESLVMKNLIKKPIPFVAPKKVSPPSAVTENQENKNQGAVPKILEPKCKLSQKSVAVLSELNTDKRAKQRKEFEEQMKKKLTEEEQLKWKEEQDRLEREKAENLELRKKREIKARPMPVYKTLNIIKSNKPLTEAQSPHWAKSKSRS